LVTFGGHKLQLENKELPNVYVKEINAFDSLVKANDEKRVSSLNVPTEPQMYKTLDETSCTYVDTEEQLASMVEKLADASEIAIDLEHHHERTYLGLTCLIQISTRDEDFIVDPLSLKTKLGDALRPILDDPSIVKVLHGADHDIEWLQRDFGLYIVNMFDTG